MKYARFLIAGLTLVFLVYAIFIVFEGNMKNKKPDILPLTTKTTKQWDTKIDNQGQVFIKITPIELGTNKEVQEWKFDIALDTHFKSLDEDLMQSATLLDDEGNVYKPIALNGDEPGGHHRKGILVFRAISPLPKFIEIKIKNVGGILERTFKWNIND